MEEEEPLVVSMMQDFDEEDTQVGAVMSARQEFMRKSATEQMPPRYVSESYYGNSNPNTPDGCLIFPFNKQWTVGEEPGTVRVSFDEDSPREEVVAVLRHLAAALEEGTCTLPPRPVSGRGGI